MTAHPKITRDSLLTLEAYARQRAAMKARVIPHRRLRSVCLGDHLMLQFEDETTIRYQIQEMLRVEKIFEEEGIQGELEAYLPLVPDGSNWKATMMLEYPDVDQRRIALGRLIGIEDRVYVQASDYSRVYAIADEDLPRERADKTSSVHFLRFELTPEVKAAILGGAGVRVGVDHPEYLAEQSLGEATLQALREDLR